MPPVLGIEIRDAPGPWSALGFAASRGAIVLGRVTLTLTGTGGGIRGWTLEGDGGPPELDGLRTAWGRASDVARPPHPNGATRLDHVVVLTDDLERTTAAFAGVGERVRRIREPPESPVRQAFLRLGDLVVEVVERERAPARRARFWGLVAVVGDLDAAAERLGPRLGAARDAVQPGRRIATVRRDAGIGPALALMTPHVAGSNPAAARPAGGLP
jgi:hypothetical protein